jgi:hypothetical protein
MAVMPRVSKSAAAQAWRDFLVALPNLLRMESDRQIQLESDGSGSPAQLALRDAFYAFPVLTDVLLLDTDGCSLQHGEERFWTLLNFDFSVTCGDLMRFHGIASASKIKRHTVLLDTHFSLRVTDLGSLRGLLLMGQQYDYSLVHLVSYNARDQIERYSAELASYLLSCTGTLSRFFSKQPDFNTLWSAAGSRGRREVPAQDPRYNGAFCGSNNWRTAYLRTASSRGLANPAYSTGS